MPTVLIFLIEFRYPWFKVSLLLRGGRMKSFQKGMFFLSCCVVFLAYEFALFSAQVPALEPISDGAKVYYQSLENEIKRQYDTAKKAGDLEGTLLTLSFLIKDAIQKGEKAPDYNLCDLGKICKDNKGISRIDMPQLGGIPIPGTPADALPKDKKGEVDAKEYFAKDMAKKYKITDIEMVPVTSLKSTQNELVASKVAGIWAALLDPKSSAAKDINNSYIFISKDNYVLDGHHRWAARLADAIRKGEMDAKIRVRQIKAPIDTLIQEANDWANKFGIQPAAGLAPVAHISPTPEQ